MFKVKNYWTGKIITESTSFLTACRAAKKESLKFAGLIQVTDGQGKFWVFKNGTGIVA